MIDLEPKTTQAKIRQYRSLRAFGVIIFIFLILIIFIELMKDGTVNWRFVFLALMCIAADYRYKQELKSIQQSKVEESH